MLAAENLASSSPSLQLVFDSVDNSTFPKEKAFSRVYFDDVIKIFGQPATKGMTDENLWIYIERTQVKGKLLKLGRNQLVKNNVLVLNFNKYGILGKKTFFDINDMNEIDFEKEVTLNDTRSQNFIYSFLSSIRQKMESPD